VRQSKAFVSLCLLICALSFQIVQAQDDLLWAVRPQHPLTLTNPLSTSVRYPLWGAVIEAAPRIQLQIKITERSGAVILWLGRRVSFPLDKDTHQNFTVELGPDRMVLTPENGEPVHTLFEAPSYEIGLPLGVDLEIAAGASITIEELTLSPQAQVVTLGDVSLQALAEPHGINIGVATDIYPPVHDLAYEQLLAHEAGLLAPTEFYWTTTRPAEDVFYFLPADMMVNFALANGQRVRGYHLIWDFELPSWVANGNLLPAQLAVAMRDHITGTISHFRGRVAEWVVVNEAVWGPEATGEETAEFAQSLWYDTFGQAFIERAFRTAHEADPDAVLIYNETGMEALGVKSDFVYDLMQDYVEGGVPVDAIGLQMHIDAANPPDPESVVQNMQRFGDLGLQVIFTELDVNMADVESTEEERLALQAEIYASMLDACLQVLECSSYTLWSLNDRYAWLELGAASPAILDASNQPKPAYDALVAGLK
jgi:endo-1,4-beta-xylanase